MAQLVGVFLMSHSPFCYSNPDGWNETRMRRSLRADVPLDDIETNRGKFARVQASFATLKRRLAETGADVIVIFGDDQLECFDFRNFPPFSVYVGASFEGFLAEYERPVGNRQFETPRKRAQVTGHPEFAVALLTGLMKHGFDPSFSMDMPKPEGLGHAFIYPVQSLTDFGTPVVPVLINCFYAPQPTAQRCYALGKAVRAIIDEFPANLRVALIGSGGLWHTPRKPDAWIDEAFDDALLAHMTKGNIRAMAAYFDDYRVPPSDKSQDISVRGLEVTGMPGVSGPQGGTRETCTWIAAAAAAEGTTATIVDRVKIYASPIDTAFAHLDI
jgi:hypothetical protein